MIRQWQDDGRDEQHYIPLNKWLSDNQKIIFGRIIIYLMLGDDVSL